MEKSYENIIKNLKDVPAEVSQELLNIIKNHEPETGEEFCTCDLVFTENTKDYLISNLISEPYETSLVIKKIHKIFERHKISDKKLIFFENALNIYLTNEDLVEPKIFYLILKNLENEVTLSENSLIAIFDLIKNQKLEKNLIFLSLISRENLDLLNQFLDFENQYIQNVDIKEPNDIFNYTLQNKHHWILHFLKNDTQILDFFTQKSLAQKVLFLKLVFLTNEPNQNFRKIESTFLDIDSKCFSGLEKYYLVEIQRSLNVFKEFLKVKTVNFDTFLLNITQKSGLEIIFELFNSDNFQNFELVGKIKKILVLNQIFVTELETLKGNVVKTEHSPTELDVFNSYIFLLLISKNLESTSENLDFLNYQKSQIMQISSTDLQVKILELGFALIFLNNSPKNFQKSMFLSTFLKTCIKELKNKIRSQKNENVTRISVLLKFVNDFLFRLDLLKFQNVEKNFNKIDIFKSNPKTLVFLCLENGDFGKAHEIIEVFNIKDPLLENNIDFSEKYQYFFSKYINSQNTPENIDDVLKFFSENSHLENFKSPDNLDTFKFFEKNSTYLNLVDFALTQNLDIESSKKIISEIKKSKNFEDDDYSRLSDNLIKIFENGNFKNLQELLVQSRHKLNFYKYIEKSKYYMEISTLYQNFVILNDPKREPTYLELTQKTSSQGDYLFKIYNYLKNLGSLLSFEGDIFDILVQNRAQKIGEIFFDQKHSPRDLEKKFQALELDIVYYISFNCMPVIKLQKTTEPFFKNEKLIQNVNFENCDGAFETYLGELKSRYLALERVQNEIRAPNFELLSYIRRRNWLLAHLINKIFKIETDTESVRTKFLKNMLNLEKTQTLKVLFDDNEVLTALQAEVSIEHFLKYFENNTRDWKFYFKLLSAFPEKSFLNKDLQFLKDLIIFKIFSNDLKPQSDILGSNIVESQISSSDLPQNQNLSPILSEVGTEVLKSGQESPENLEVGLIVEENGVKSLENDESTVTLTQSNILESTDDILENSLLVQSIANDGLRITCILNNLKNWPSKICIEILENELTTENNLEIKSELEKWLKQIKLYEKLTHLWKEMNSWYDIYLASVDRPKLVFQWLLDTPVQISTLLDWLKIHENSVKNDLNLINEHYFQKILKTEVQKSDFTDIRKLLDFLPFDQKINLSKTLLNTSRNLKSMQFFLEYLIYLLPEIEADFRDIKLSLVIISVFNPSEHEKLFYLIKKPLLIIEQLIMNCRLEKLSQILEKIREDSFLVEKIDRLLCIYAEKALAFRGIQPNIQKKNLEFKLLQSLDTLSEDTNESRKNFIMPENVPSKEDWIKNEMACECMCCQTVIFSMFNRRHHCRRCGRVICGNCSTRRIELPEYSNLPVRICDDCYKQSNLTQTSSLRSDQSSKSDSNQDWILTDDESQNSIVREEFSYEYAPSVSLCLSIIKLHSGNVEHPRFLLQLCKKLLPNLQEIVKEIDYSFLIQMLKSLATAAKIISLNQNFKEELKLSNEMLLQIELLGLLASKGCLEVLPFCQPLLKKNTKITDFDFISNSKTVLRKLNEKLIELEQWNLALEVSTKCGLDKKIIFANWGMSLLKSGALILAREKFNFCLEKKYFENFGDLNTSVTISNVSENRPLKTPPLVNEIISALENQNISLSNKKIDIESSAFCVLNKLKNLQNIIDDKKLEKNEFETFENRIYLEPIFYNECLYYLHKYGSHISILKFYIKYSDYREALNYFLENRLPTDIFVEIYMSLVENNKIEIFHSEMQKMDPNLYVWEVYLRSICAYLEKTNMFNLLYNLQVFMCDYVRASMTCIKFYKDNATNFTDLNDREHYLLTAQNHLKQELENEQWVKISKTPDRKMSTTSSDSSNFEKTGFNLKINPRNIDKHINTIWRQIEVVKFLANCELEKKPTVEILDQCFKIEDADKNKEKRPLPTLFDSNFEKIQLSTLALLCGNSIVNGFGIAFRIIQDYNLKFLKVYCISAKYLVEKMPESSILEFISCIKSSGLSQDIVNNTCDEILTVCIHTLIENNINGARREKLIKMITEPGAKISAYIECKQLKCAYLLAVQHNRNNDIRRILREADKLNQPQIKAICIKRLSQMQ